MPGAPVYASITSFWVVRLSARQTRIETLALPPLRAAASAASETANGQQQAQVAAVARLLPDRERRVRDAVAGIFGYAVAIQVDDPGVLCTRRPGESPPRPHPRTAAAGRHRQPVRAPPPRRRLAGDADASWGAIRGVLGTVGSPGQGSRGRGAEGEHAHPTTTESSKVWERMLRTYGIDIVRTRLDLPIQIPGFARTARPTAPRERWANWRSRSIFGLNGARRTSPK